MTLALFQDSGFNLLLLSCESLHHPSGSTPEPKWNRGRARDDTWVGPAGAPSR